MLCVVCNRFYTSVILFTKCWCFIICYMGATGENLFVTNIRHDVFDLFTSQNLHFCKKKSVTILKMWKKNMFLVTLMMISFPNLYDYNLEVWISVRLRQQPNSKDRQKEIVFFDWKTKDTGRCLYNKS